MVGLDLSIQLDKRKVVMILRLISKFIQGRLSVPVFVVCQNYVDNNNKYWSLSFYRTRRGAINKYKMAHAWDMVSDKDVVIKLNSFRDITKLVKDQSERNTDDFLDGRVIVAQFYNMDYSENPEDYELVIT